MHHFVERRNELAYFFLCVDYGHHDWTIRREKEMAFVDERARTVAFDAAKYGGAGDIELAALDDDRFIERLVLPLVILAEMNTKHFGFAFQLHLTSPSAGRTSGSCGST